MLGQLLGLRHALVIHHLCSQRDGGDRSLQLMGHIVDEIVLYLRIALLTEDNHNREEEGDEQYDGKDDAWNHEPYAGKNVAAHFGEMHLDNTHLRLRIVLEEVLRVSVFLTFFRIVGTTVNFTAIGSRHGEVVWDVDTVIGQFLTDIVVEHTEIDAFLQGFVASSIQYIIYHLVEQTFLIDITVADYFLHGLRSINQRILVLTQNHGLGNAGRLQLEGLQLERGIDSTIVSGNGKLMGVFDRTQPVAENGVLLIGTALSFLDVFFQIACGLVNLQMVGCLIKTAVNTLVELLFLHLDHLLDIGELKIEQRQE